MNKIIVLLSLVIFGCSKEVDITYNPPVINVPNSPVPIFPVGSTMPTDMIVNGPLVFGGDVQEQFQHTPDGSKIVYIADESVNGTNELYVANSDTSNKRKLQGVPAGRKVSYFIISPDSQRVVFLMDLDNVGLYDLYSIKIDGTELTKLNAGIPVASGRSVSKTFKITPDSQKVVFVTDENTGLRDLFISNIVAPVNRTQLNSVTKTPVASVFEIAPDGSRIVYKESSDLAHPNIRSVQPTALNDVQLNPNFTLPASGASDFTISPLSSKVVYRANQDDDAIYELYSVNTDGSGSVSKINGSIVSGGSVQPLQFKITSNGSKVVYLADQQTDEQFELYVSNIDGSSNTKISGTMIGTADVSDFKLTSDNSKVLFRANAASTAQELFSVSILGSGLVKINSSLIAGENVGEYQIRGNKVAYSMDKGSVGVYSIYSANLDGTLETKLNPNIFGGVGFYDPAQSSLTGTRQIGFSFDGSRIVMVGSTTGTVLDIYSVDVNGSNFKKVNSQTGGNIVLNSTPDGSGFLTLPSQHIAVYRYNDGSKTQLYVGLIKE